MLPKPDLSPVLAGLKDFQRATVDYAFERLYGPDATRRFLVADEVGLGKTLIARGIIAKTIERLWDEVDRIDVVYVCSNSDIARQNIKRLRIRLPEQGDFALPSRLTLLPTVVQNLKANKVNYISFTPGTSLDLRSSLGMAEERVLLYWLVCRAWNLRGAAPLNIFQGNMGADGFRSWVDAFDQTKVDRTLRDAFCSALHGRPDLRQRFNGLLGSFSNTRRRRTAAESSARASLIGDLRSLLAATCLQALQPDLIIVDEFQRFKHLLRPGEEDRAAQLAQELFNYSDDRTQARVLLLSATPYKMYTVAHETEEDHYRDFAETLRFLLGSTEATRPVEALLREYRRELYRLGDAGSAPVELERIKADLEGQLRRVMVRTERLAASPDRSGMLKSAACETPHLEKEDFHAYVALQRVVRQLPGRLQRDVLEYWKAAPYLLNFMDEYEVKVRLREALSPAAPREAVRSLAQELARGAAMLFPTADWERYERLDPGNARLRQLLADTVDRGAWRLLWIPPALPYYRLEGPFADPQLRSFTKRLVFSAWQVVPKTVAALLSYEAERQMIRSLEAEAENSKQARQRRRPLLRFAQQTAELRRTNRGLTGMPVLALMYPSVALAELGDPLQVSRAWASELKGRGLPARSTVLRAVQRRIEARLAELPEPGDDHARSDENWYWAAPLLLDLQQDPDGTRAWFARRDLATRWSEGGVTPDEEGEHSHWDAHVELARDLVFNPETVALGRRPKDLAQVLALLAVAGPGVTALRALRRVSGSSESAVLREPAGQVAWAFRSLFNVPEFTALLRGLEGEVPYWRRVLEYSLDGCLQATLDEYGHVLREALGLSDGSPEEIAAEVAAAMRGALMLQASSLGADDLEISPDGNGAELGKKLSMRCRFALRFGEQRSESGTQVARSGQVRDTFNSPFWPFVLVTTSVGQEGLDFHPYCHAVVHWDLPSNPVDLEQREGRVHRYKGHAVRKNLAQRYGLGTVESTAEEPWDQLFAAGRKDRPAEATDLVPYWIYPVPNGAAIERHVYGFPLSRDQERLARLQRSLALYRMVFGQSRQEELLCYLRDRVAEADLEGAMRRAQIDLSP